MIYLIVQTVLLLAIAFILGAILGCLLRRFFSADAKPAPAAVRSATSPAAVGQVASSQRAPHVPSAPLPLQGEGPTVVPQPIKAAPVAPPPTAPTPVEAELVDLPEEAVTTKVAGTRIRNRAEPERPEGKGCQDAGEDRNGEGAQTLKSIEGTPRPKADPAAGEPTI